MIKISIQEKYNKGKLTRGIFFKSAILKDECAKPVID